MRRAGLPLRRRARRVPPQKHNVVVESFRGRMQAGCLTGRHNSSPATPENRGMIKVSGLRGKLKGHSAPVQHGCILCAGSHPTLLTT